MGVRESLFLSQVEESERAKSERAGRGQTALKILVERLLTVGASRSEHNWKFA